MTLAGLLGCFLCRVGRAEVGVSVAPLRGFWRGTLHFGDPLGLGQVEGLCRNRGGKGCVCHSHPHPSVGGHQVGEARAETKVRQGEGVQKARRKKKLF